MYEIVDISHWEFVDISTSGTKTKRWYRDPINKSLVLFKLPVSVTENSWVDKHELSGEMWAEKIASEIGPFIDVDVHKVNIGSIVVDEEVKSYYGIEEEQIINGIIYGTLCYSFLSEGESLVEGADMIMDFDETYNRNKLQGSVEAYTFSLLYKLFDKYNMLNELYKMLLFDTLIGNTDRHQDNFGIIKNEKNGTVRFAPLYDNSSCLGRELIGSRLEGMITNKDQFNAYLHGRKSRSMIRWGDIKTLEKLNIFELFQRATNEYQEILNRVSSLRNLTEEIIKEIVNNVPTEVMSDLKKEVVIKILVHRRNYLLKEFVL